MDGGGVKARLADIAAHADVSRGDGQPRAQRQARRGRGDPAGGAHRPRRARLRPALPAAAQERRARRPDRPGADQPDLPGLRPDHRDRAGAERLHPGALHADAGRSPRGRLRADAARPRRRRDHLHLRPARRHHDRLRALRHAARARPAASSSSTATSRASTRPSSPTTTSPRWSSALEHLVALGHTADRSGGRARPLRAGHPQDRGLPALDAEAARAATTSTTSSSARSSRSRAGDSRRPPARPRAATAVVCGSDLMALGAIREARKRGLEVPRDFSVVGYDDSTLIAFTDPPLTTVRQSVNAMSAATVRALLDEIAGQPSPRAEYVFRPGARRARVHRRRAAAALTLRRDGIRPAASLPYGSPRGPAPLAQRGTCRPQRRRAAAQGSRAACGRPRRARRRRR